MCACGNVCCNKRGSHGLQVGLGVGGRDVCVCECFGFQAAFHTGLQGLLGKGGRHGSRVRAAKRQLGSTMCGTRKRVSSQSGQAEQRMGGSCKEVCVRFQDYYVCATGVQDYYVCATGVLGLVVNPGTAQVKAVVLH